MNLIIFLSSYIVIIISIFGYSLILHEILKKNIKLEFEFSLLGSIFFLIFLSFLSHFFFKHGYLHNTIILLVGVLSFFFFFNRYSDLAKSYSKYLIPIFLLLIIALLSAKTHDDFPYYHFPYTFYLTQENLIVGTGNLNHGFRTPSSIFYLNSLFYLPIIKYFSFNIGPLLILGISNLILIFKLKNDLKDKKYDFIFILTLLSLLFINIFFYRLSEHGTDRSAQILIFILFIEVLSLLRKNIKFERFFSKIFILLGIIISLKAFYVLYILIFVPIFYYIKKKEYKKIIENFFSNLYFYLFLCVGLFLIMVNIFNSGCVLYPVSITCFSFFEWSLLNEAKQMNNWYELWSKAGATPNSRVENPLNYIEGFNWVHNWINLYFFNKVSDFLAGLLLLITIVFLTLYSKKKIEFKLDKKIYVIYLILSVLFLEWFYNHPSLRYGGYSLIGLMIFIPVSIYFSKFIFKKNLKKKVIFLIILSLIIFSGRNINRINHEIIKYDYQFISSPFYKLDKNHFRVNSLIKDLIEGHENCDNKNLNVCKDHEAINIGKRFNYYYLMKKND